MRATGFFLCKKALIKLFGKTIHSSCCRSLSLLEAGYTKRVFKVGAASRLGHRFCAEVKWKVEGKSRLPRL
jgi:hypothetical protein